MRQFSSGWSFIRFCESVRHRYRYARVAEVDEFLAALAESSETRVRSIPIDSLYWRAQLGTAIAERKIEDSDLTVYCQVDIPLSAERMVPLRYSAHEGRVNPKGIPCLYLATDKETAMSEVRPWNGAKISIATFNTTRVLRVVDCTLHHNVRRVTDVLLGEPSPEEITEGVWAQVDQGFSEPVNDEPATAEYAPTQIMAEAFRQAGFDGVVFRSRLGSGFNLALFDLDSAKLSNRALFKVEAIDYHFVEELP